MTKSGSAHPDGSYLRRWAHARHRSGEDSGRRPLAPGRTRGDREVAEGPRRHRLRLAPCASIAGLIWLISLGHPGAGQVARVAGPARKVARLGHLAGKPVRTVRIAGKPVRTVRIAGKPVRGVGIAGK